MIKHKRKHKIKVIPYYRWKVALLLPFGISFIIWISLMELEVISHIGLKIILTTAFIGGWLLGACWIWIRADARHFPLDPRLPYSQ